MNFITELLQLPSVRQFVDGIVDDLSMRRSTLVLLPAGVEPSDIWSALRAELWRRDFWFRELWLPDSTCDNPSVAELGEMLEVDWGSLETPRTMRKLMSFEGLPDVVQLAGLEQLPDEFLERWGHFLVQWAEASQSLAGQGHMPTALCMVVSADAILKWVPDTGVYLAVHWWWGFPSALEMHLLCRLKNGGLVWDERSRWREHLLPAVSSSDVRLVEYLWDDLERDVQELSEKLHAFATDCNWSATALQAWGAEQAVTVSGSNHASHKSSPPSQLRALWANGVLSCTAERGVELHTAALAMLGLREQMSHRLWRGQAELLLPLIDHLRLTLCNHLTRKYGNDWPVRWHQPKSAKEEEAVRNNPLACQWGHLQWLLGNCDHLKAERWWLRLVSLASWIRNEIAHYRPVSFRDFEGFWRESERIDMLLLDSA